MSGCRSDIWSPSLDAAYVASEDGARVVEEMLGRIEHGIFA